MKHYASFFWLLICFFNINGQGLVLINSYNLKIDEPSDIFYQENSNKYYIVSDNGYLHETNEIGEVLRTARFKGTDFEGVFQKDNIIYVVEEMLRKIYQFNTNFELVKTTNTQYNGGRNKGFESITFIPERNSFLLISEKDPVFFREYDENFIQKNEFIFSNLRDVSSVTYFKKHIYILSDEDRTIIKMNTNFEEISRTTVPVINPEGLTFDDEGNLLVVSDNRCKLYQFSYPW